MRYALISDIHANLPALDAVLSQVQGDAFDAVYHLGDLVGYAPWPNEVVERIKASGIAGVAGNYDSTVATDYKHCGCRYEDPKQEALSHLSYAWTREHVSASTKAFLGTLPFRIDVRPLGGHVSGPTLTLVHGNQTLNTVYVTEDRSDDFLAKMGGALGARAGDIVAFGHTHKPWHRVVSGVHFVNTGSVGRPKDGDSRASYVSLEISQAGIAPQIVRVEYDLDSAASGIIDSALPNEFAEYLRTGGKVVTSGTLHEAAADSA
ncbi:MAG: metallophosphoesterase family protein [Gemmatimonadaceae bacterium]